MATVRREPEPAPLPTASGIMPATSEAVVIRMGRSRSSQPRRIASRRGRPSRRSLDVVDLQNGVLLDDPEQHQDADRAVDDREVLPMTISDSRAKGTDRGRLTRMVTGSMKLSNCAASTMYMNTMESTKART
jgi:hypothetical protein